MVATYEVPSIPDDSEIPNDSQDEDYTEEQPDIAPDALTGLMLHMDRTMITRSYEGGPTGSISEVEEYYDYQMFKLTETEFIRLDENQTVISSPLSYTYTKTGPATGTITTVDNFFYSFTTYNLVFEGSGEINMGYIVNGTGEWSEDWGYKGNLTFELSFADDDIDDGDSDDDRNEPKLPEHAQVSSSSVRAYVGAGEANLIYGFSLKTKQSVFIKAQGPSLSNLGVVDAMSDPRISLLDSAGVEIAENDDWSSSANYSEIESRSLASETPLESVESALLLDLQAGSYSLVVRPFEGSQEGTAILTVEAAVISNISVRGLVGSDPFVHGIVLSGPSESDVPAEVLASAKGSASLAQYGVSNGLSNPSITLYDPTNQTIGENDDWSGIELPRVRGFEKPKGAQEAVLLSTLDQGSYHI